MKILLVVEFLFSKDPHVVEFSGDVILMYYTLPPRLDVSGSGANIGIASSKIWLIGRKSVK